MFATDHFRPLGIDLIVLLLVLDVQSVDLPVVLSLGLDGGKLELLQRFHSGADSLGQSGHVESRLVVSITGVVMIRHGHVALKTVQAVSGKLRVSRAVPGWAPM